MAIQANDNIVLMSFHLQNESVAYDNDKPCISGELNFISTRNTCLSLSYATFLFRKELLPKMRITSLHSFFYSTFRTMPFPIPWQ